MCGIAGMVNFDGRPVQGATLQAITNALGHRGPDGAGIFCQGQVGLGHRRLAIIDPDGGVQPFFNHDRSLVLSYNGEIYNYLEIRAKLATEAPFRTQSDTEVLLRAYEKWGIACVQHFRGMFAFALYDARTMTLYLVRDRLGIKPLYYYHAGHCFRFASELAALLQDPAVQRQIDPAGVAGFLRYQYVPTPGTIYKHTYKLDPGHFLAVDVRRGVVEKQQYWRLPVQVTQRSEADCLEALNAALDEVIKIYVRSDVPFGAFLSGGVDSSLVTALMARHLSEPVRTFTIGFGEPQYSELPFAAEASRVLHTRHHEKVLAHQLAVQLLPRLAVHFGEPFGDSSAVPTYYVAREAGQQVKMVLSGDGGDELFGGYEAYALLAQEYGLAPYNPATLPASRLTSFSPLRRVRAAAYTWGKAAWKGARLPRPAFARAVLQAVNPPVSLWERYDLYRSVFNEAWVRKLLQPDLAVIPNLSAPGAADRCPESSLDPLTWSAAQDVKTYLLDDILTKVDRASMANSLEVRVPFLDHQLVELALTIPPTLKLRLHPLTQQLETKYLLKKSASRFFPEAFLTRPKMGFGIPVAEWLRTPLKGLLEEELGNPRQPIFDWLRFAVVQEVLARLFAGEDSHAPQAWCLLMFSLWMRHVHMVR